VPKRLAGRHPAQVTYLKHFFYKAGGKAVEWIIENWCIMQCRDNNEDAKCTRMGLIKKFDAVTPDLSPSI
jgi:hypothetical protein